MKKPGGRVTAPDHSNPPERTVAEEYKILLEMLKQQADSIEALRQTVTMGHERSSESRGKLHERIDEVGDRLGKIEGDIRILGQVDGQLRGEVQGLAAQVTKHQEEAQPTIDEWRRIKAIGIGIVGLLALGGVSIGATFAWAGENVINWARHLLRIS